MAARVLFAIFAMLIVSGTIFCVNGVPYDHFFTNECLAEPLDPQYGGGIAEKPKFKEELDVQFHVRSAQLRDQKSSMSKFPLENDKLYAFSAWVKASKGNAYVEAVFATNTRNITAGWVTTKEGCWSMLKGGLVVPISGPAELHFKINDSSTADIKVASISLQPFTQEEWEFHQRQKTEEVRKRMVKLQVVDGNGQPISNVTVSFKQNRPNFPIGCATNSQTLTIPEFRSWFSSRFKYTVFENELRWPYVTDYSTGVYNYNNLDTLLNFTRSHGIAVRGHPIHTSDLKAQPNWVRNRCGFDKINDTETFRSLVNNRTKDLVKRYAGQFFHWDVVNEDMHDRFFENVLGENAGALQYHMVHEMYPKAQLFLNEFHTIGVSADGFASPWKYLERVWQLRQYGYKGPVGMGVAGRFDGDLLNLPYVRASLDVLQSGNVPLWITELLVGDEAGSHQAEYLEKIMRELYAHKVVQGIMIWAARTRILPNYFRCWKMCLTDDKGVNLPTGDVVDKLMAEWKLASGLQLTTDSRGYIKTSLYYGDYEAEIINITTTSPCPSLKFTVAPLHKRKTSPPVKLSYTRS